MQRVIDAAATEFSALLLAAAFTLIAASLLGVGGTLALAAVLAGATVALALGRERLGATVSEAPLAARILEDVWIATAAATATVVVALGASPGELQTLGGLIGLAGMLNYFLRPLYRLSYRAGRRLSRAMDG